MGKRRRRTPTRLCIYCKANPADGKEHWILRSLGRFQGYEPLLNTVCQRCNETLGGSIDDEFAHASPEAVIRHRLGIQGRKTHKRVNPYYHRTDKDHPVMSRIWSPEAKFWMLNQPPQGDTHGSPLRQLVFRLKEGDDEAHFDQIAIPDNPSADVLNRVVAERGVTGSQLVAVIGSGAEQATLIRLVRSTLENCNGDARYYVLDGPTEVFFGEAKQYTKITHAYWRAVAKTAFHYALKFYPELDGGCAAFDGIRAYIASGGDPAPFVEYPSRQFIHQLADGAQPVQWGHHFMLEHHPTSPIIVRVQFNVGPDYLAPTFAITIGNAPTDTGRYMAHYAYYYSKQKNGHDGVIVRLPGFTFDEGLPYRDKWGFAKGDHKFAL